MNRSGEKYLQGFPILFLRALPQTSDTQKPGAELFAEKVKGQKNLNPCYCGTLKDSSVLTLLQVW